MPDFLWKPIEPLSDRDRAAINIAAMKPIYEVWQDYKARLKDESGEDRLQEFKQRLIRKSSIETGLLEQLYDIDRGDPDRGITEALVAHGFRENVLPSSHTGNDKALLIATLRDHEAAIQLVMDCVSNRQLTKSVIHELHSIITRHQDKTIAIDRFGRLGEIPLLKGEFKKVPNNPRRNDGSVYHFCDPIHVDSEIENLLSWFSSYEQDDPIIVCAWFHHRFTQIHPYQDGNGRLARALATLILVRAELLPLVVDRDHRVEYIKALESADANDLAPLASLFASIERATILEAVSVDDDKVSYSQHGVTYAVIDKYKRRMERDAELRQRRGVEHDAALRLVNTIAKALRLQACTVLKEDFHQLDAAVRAIDMPTIRVIEGGSDKMGPGGKSTAHWYREQVMKSAKAVGKFANFAEDHYFVKASMHVGRERLVFVTSFHHIGRRLSGIMEATAFATLESFDEYDDKQPPNFFVCSLEPFVFTNKTAIGDIKDDFSRWLDPLIATAVDRYLDRLLNDNYSAIANAPQNEQGTPLKLLLTSVIAATPQDDDGWVLLSLVGSQLLKADPSFDPCKYGFEKLGELVRAQPYLEIKSTPSVENPLIIHYSVRVRET